MPPVQTSEDTRASKGEKPHCHIHDNANEDEVDDIHSNVCVNELPFAEHADGKHYCHFHLPTANKDHEKFQEIFFARLESIDTEIFKTNDLPDEKREAALEAISYDFHYVWFPCEFDLRNRIFGVYADFRSSTFSASVDLSKSTFSSYADFRSATFSASADFRSATFSARAFFEAATFSGAADFSSTRFSYANFTSATFSAGADFSEANFSAFSDFTEAAFSAPAYFGRAAFSAHAFFSSATFSADGDFRSASFFADAAFESATFSADAIFSSATFSGDAAFSSAAFSAHADFSSGTFVTYAFFNSATFFDWADFSSAKFLENSQVFFHKTNFNGFVDFGFSTFAGYATFEGDRKEGVFSHIEGENSSVILNLQNARLEKPARISFHRVRLCPGWFVNVDSREIVYTDIRWNNLDHRYDNSNIKPEIESLEKREISEPSRLLEIACRQLAVNAEENNRYEEASKFRLMANETKRLEKSRGFAPWTLHWWYWLSSSYGESWRRAMVVLAMVLVIFAIGYTRVNFYVCPADVPVSQSSQAGKCETRKLDFPEAVRHSLATALFQNVEYRKPVTWRSDLLVLLEKIFAPLQAALLALAIRRKFMR